MTKLSFIQFKVLFLTLISEDLPEGAEGDLAKIMGFRMKLI